MNANSHIQRYWDFRAFFYSLYYRFPLLSVVSVREHKSALKLWESVENAVHSGIHIDAACGTKPLIFSSGFKLEIGVDSSLSAGVKVKSNCSQCQVIAADAIVLPVKNGSADLITALGLSEYLQYPEEFIEEINRVSTSTGILILSFSQKNLGNNLRRLWNPRIFLRDFSFWQALLEKYGFKVVSIKKLPLQIQILAQKTA